MRAGLAWKTLWDDGERAVRFMLQWGHADDGVEDVETELRKGQPKRLQWGHADDGVEDLRLVATLMAAPSASMGPRR